MEIYFGGWGNINKWAFIGWIGNDWRYPLKFGNGWKSSILRGFPPARNSSSATRTSAPWCSGGSPLSCGPSRCRCGLALDPYGDHCAACATTGVLRARAAPIERAVARICREAGARVAVNVPLSRMNLSVPVTDARQIEVLANDLPLWHGAQLALDVTLVSPLGRTGQVSPRPTRPRARRSWQPPSASGNIPRVFLLAPLPPNHLRSRSWRTPAPALRQHSSARRQFKPMCTLGPASYPSLA